MKDKQIAPANAEPRIFLVSPVLHCVSMTAVVYLRSSFGFGYLRPRSLFLAGSWAFILYAIYAWIADTVWRQHRALLIFGTGAVALYIFHLTRAFVREWNQRGEHESYSGASHLVRVLRLVGHPSSAEFEARLHLWAEPATLLLVSATLRLAVGERGLSLWLFVAAICFWFKEALNHWFEVRQRKRRGDMFDDAEDAVEPTPNRSSASESLQTARKAKIKRTRSVEATAADTSREQRFAEILRLLPPYTIEKAEANYRELIKIDHPDVSGYSEENNSRAKQLNEAVDYFRLRSKN